METKRTETVVEKEPKKLSNIITPEERQEIDDRAKAIAKREGVCKVHVFIALEPETNERIIAFLKEPSYLQKIMTYDKISTLGAFSAGDELREACTLKQDSDYRTYSENPEFDNYKFGLTTFCISMTEIAKDVFKKK